MITVGILIILLKYHILSFLECVHVRIHTRTHKLPFFSCDDRKPSSVLIRDVAVGPRRTPASG